MFIKAQFLPCTQGASNRHNHLLHEGLVRSEVVKPVVPGRVKRLLAPLDHDKPSLLRRRRPVLCEVPAHTENVGFRE